MSAPLFILMAWAIEVLFGWPDKVYARIRHPVVWLGSLISFLERNTNHPHLSHAVRYGLGFATSLIVVSAFTGLAWAIAYGLPNIWWGYVLEGVIASSLIASRSLYDHVSAVARPLLDGETERARAAVSQIVGRDPRSLDDSGMSRASLESLAENASDGVIAPVFWGAIFGLPGIAGYKAINTLDSMIGHKNEKYAAFGGFAARLDDMANWVPARISGFLIAAASLQLQAFQIMFKNARTHRSPNAGWPEAAMAGALGVRLSGPRSYGAHTTNEPWLHEGARDPDAADIVRGLSLYQRALGLGALLLGAVALAWEVS